MTARPSVLALCVGLSIMPVLAKDNTSAPRDTVACEGVFGPQSSEALLIETFGAENVVTGQVPGNEGFESLATTIFPNDPEKIMQITWWDEVSRERLTYVDLAPSQVGPLGIRLGMTVAEVEALNGEPFMIGGFGWDYGGYAVFKSGKLSDLPGGCSLLLRFVPQDKSTTPDIDVIRIMGDVQVPSREPLLEQLDPRVRVLSLGYPSPEGVE